MIFAANVNALGARLLDDAADDIVVAARTRKGVDDALEADGDVLRSARPVP